MIAPPSASRDSLHLTLPRAPPTHYVYLSSTVGAPHRAWSCTYHARCMLRMSQPHSTFSPASSNPQSSSARPPCPISPTTYPSPYPFLMQDGRRDAPLVGATSFPARSPGACLTFVASPEHCTPDSGQAAPYLSSSTLGSPSRLMCRGLYTRSRTNACPRRTCARYVRETFLLFISKNNILKQPQLPSDHRDISTCGCQRRRGPSKDPISLKTFMCGPCRRVEFVRPVYDRHAHAVVLGQVCYTSNYIRTDFSDKIK